MPFYYNVLPSKKTKSHFVLFWLQILQRRKKLSLTFGLLHMRWFNVCCLCIHRILLCLKISITCVTPALCSNGQNFPAKRLRKILAYQIRMRQLFKKIQAQVNEYYRSFIVFSHNIAKLTDSHAVSILSLTRRSVENCLISLRDFCNCCSFISN